MGVLKILFALLILIYPFAQIARIQFPNGVAVILNDLFLFLTLFTYFLFKVYKKRIVLKGSLLKPVVIFSAISLFSLVFSSLNLNIEERLISAMYLVRWLAFFALYLLIFDFKKEYIQKTKILLLISGLMIVVIGYIQFFLFPSLKGLFYLGWDEHLYRMFSTFLDPNFAGAFFVVYFIFTLGILSSYLNKKFTYKTYLLITISALTLFAIYLTYSRSALIMLFVSLLTYIWLKGKRKLLFVVFLLLILIVFISPKSFKTEGTNLFRTFSSFERIISMQNSTEIFLKNPLTGVGFNSYRYAQNKYFGLNNNYWKTTHSGAGADNSYLFVLATTGIIGFTAFIYLIYKLLLIGRKNIKTENGKVLIAIILGLLINSMFINSLFYVLILEWVWILTGVTENS